MHNHGNGITSWVAAAVVIAVLIFMIRWATPGEPAAPAEDAPAMEDVALEEVPSTPVAEAPVASMAPVKKAPTPAPVAVAKSTPAPKPKPLATKAPAPAAAVAATEKSAAPQAAGPTVTKAVNTWAKCWADQDVSCYLAAYSAEFVPASGASLESWKASRTKKVSAPASITVDLGPLQLVESTASQATVKFEQAYRSPTYADQSLKTLVLKKEAGGWKIIQESSVALP